MRCLVLAVLLTVAPMASVDAQWLVPVEQVRTDDYNRCMTGDRSNRTLSAKMAGCSEAEIARQEIALNRTYLATIARLPAASHARLRTGQRKWLADHDAACLRESARPAAGLPADLVRSECVLRRIGERRGWLERYR